MIEPRVGIVIVAGGSGSRFGGSLPKQFCFLAQMPVLAHTINSFARALPKAKLVVVLSPSRVEYWRNLSSRFDVAPHEIVEGGEQRFHSVRCGVEALPEDVEIIGVHDGARPLCSEGLIQRLAQEAISNGSAIPVVELRDSIREISAGGSSAIDRSKYRAVQTPQLFDAGTLHRAYQQPYEESFTDDASVVERMGERVWLVEGEYRNIKITSREDMLTAEAILNGDDNGE